MGINYNEYQMVSAKELSFHAPNGTYEEIAVKTWRNEQKKNSFYGMMLCLSGGCLLFILSRVSEQPLWLSLLFVLLFGIVFIWMFVTYRTIMTVQALVATTRVVDVGYHQNIGSEYSAGKRGYYATVRQDEDKVIAKVTVSPSQYRLCSEERTMYVIKADGICYGINALHAI